MKFTDYPKDLQRIVELTPDGLPPSAEGVSIDDDDCEILYICFGSEQAFGIYYRAEYEQCRAQWLAEKSEVDWRGLCEELTAVIDGFIEMWDGPKYAMHMIENVQAARPVADKARKALEKTK